MQRVANVAAAAFFAAALLAGAPHGARAQDAFEEGIYEISVGNLSERTTTSVLISPSGAVLIPLRHALLLTGIPNQRRTTSWRFDWPPPEFATDFNVAAGEYTRDGETRQLAPDSWRTSESEIFVDSSAVAALFGAVMRTNSAELIVTLSTEDRFPAERRLAEEARRQRLLDNAARNQTLGYAAYPAATGGFAINWDASLVNSGGVTQGVLRSIIGGSLLGGQLELGNDIGFGTDLSGSDRIARYVRPFPNSSWIKQLAVGSLVSTTPVPRYLSGFVISNAPLIRPNDFQEVVYRPSLPPGWTAEVYEGATLLGVSDATSATPIPLPVGYGFTPLRVRITGPAGQQRTEQLQYIVPASRLPARTLEYNAGAGSCRARDCEEYAFADVSQGISAFVTAGVGAGVERSGDSTVTHPYGRLSVSPRSNVAFEAQAEGLSHLHGGVQYVGRRNTSVNGSVSWFDPDDVSLGMSGTYVRLSAAVYAWERFLSTSFQGHFDQSGLADAHAFAGMPVRFGFLGAQWNRTIGTPDLFGARVFWSQRLPLFRAAAALGATSTFSREGFELAELSANVQVRRFSYLSAAAQLHGSGKGAALTLTYTIQRPFGTTLARAQVGQEGSSAVLGMNGGIAVSPRGGITPSFSGAIGKAGIWGVTFLDSNGNGRRDDGEPPVPEVPLVFEGQSEVSDSSGRYSTWDLPPVRQTRVEVDSLSLEDIRLAPLRPQFVVRLPANTFQRFDVPLIRTRELAGRVEGLDRGNLGGILIELQSSDGGLLLQSRTFSDGEYYFPRVAPGAYTLYISQSSLSALSATAEPAAHSVDVPFTAGGVVRVEPIVLTPLE